jgi:hypothetical protein
MDLRTPGADPTSKSAFMTILSNLLSTLSGSSPSFSFPSHSSFIPESSPSSPLSISQSHYRTCPPSIPVPQHPHRSLHLLRTRLNLNLQIPCTRASRQTEALPTKHMPVRPRHNYPYPRSKICIPPKFSPSGSFPQMTRWIPQPTRSSPTLPLEHRRRRPWRHGRRPQPFFHHARTPPSHFPLTPTFAPTHPTPSTTTSPSPPTGYTQCLCFACSIWFSPISGVRRVFGWHMSGKARAEWGVPCEDAGDLGESGVGARTGAGIGAGAGTRQGAARRRRQSQ